MICEFKPNELKMFSRIAVLDLDFIDDLPGDSSGVVKIKVKIKICIDMAATPLARRIVFLCVNPQRASGRYGVR